MATQTSWFDMLPVPPVAVPAVNVQRHFYRCVDCLTVAVTEGKPLSKVIDGYFGSWYGHCGACNGKIEYMGRVEKNRLVQDIQQCACDARCTHAMGPSCDCRCGGKNHGSGAVVDVRDDLGPVPVLMIDGKAKLKADVYRTLRAEFETGFTAKFGRVVDAKRAGHYLEGADYRHYREYGDIRQAFSKARELRTHHARNRKIQQLIAAVKEVR